jgi:predicted RNA-binding Zn-ribbon protein involved in translation (DUF1610 family)
VNKRAQLLKAAASAETFAEQVQALDAVAALDAEASRQAREARDLDWADTTVRQTLTPPPVHEMHTASTGWMEDLDTSGAGYEHKVIAEAAVWYGKVSEAVKDDSEEFEIQATGALRRIASKYGEAANAAYAAAVDYVSFLRRREGASGLDQVQQTTAPDGVTEHPTPLPPEVFDTFSSPIWEGNQAVQGTETSDRAPLLQEIEQSAAGGQQETEHEEQQALASRSVALGHLYDLDQFKEMQRAAARKTAADGDSSQTDDGRFPGHHGDDDDNGSAALDRLVEATGLPAEEVKQRFPNPQAAVALIDASQSKAASKTAGSWNDPHGDFQHDGGDSKCNNCANGNHTGSNGTPGCTGGDCACTSAGCGRGRSDFVDSRDDGYTNEERQAREGRKEAASGLDQIQQTTAPDGVTERPTPLPGDVMFPLVVEDEMNSEQLLDGDPRAAVEKAAALDDVSSTACRSCGEGLNAAGSNGASTCPSCGVKNYVQTKASRSFTPDDAMAHPEFFKGYGFGRTWTAKRALVTTGSAEFEAGLYAGITDNPANQAAWLAAHAKQASTYPDFSQRIAVHDAFTQRVAALKGLRTTASYVTALTYGPSGHCMNCGHNIGDHTAGCSKDGCDCGRTFDPSQEGDAAFPSKGKSARRTASTETDLMTTSPGTSPSPTGETPLNGPGRPGPLAGYDTPAESGGPSPYNGTEPFGKPVVPGAIGGAPVVAPEVTHSGPPNPFASQQTVAFRRRVQAGLLVMSQEN